MAVTSTEGIAALERVRAIALALPEVSERLSHGTPSFFIRGKKTLCNVWENHHGDGELAIWCPAPPGVQADIVEQDPDRFYAPRYVAHNGWIGMRLGQTAAEESVDWDEVASVLEEAFRHVAPKTVLRQLDNHETCE